MNLKCLKNDYDEVVHNLLVVLGVCLLKNVTMTFHSTLLKQ